VSLVDDSYELAGWWRRVGAYLIDFLVLVVSIAIVAVIGAAVSTTIEIVLLVLWAVAAIFGYWAYFEGSESGQTPGKHALGIRVRNDSGGRASYGQAVGRNIVRFLLGIIPLISLVDFLWPLWDSRKQCLHDKAASTIVVRL
jgi:uncharacterized RDD family membrane protein YckC